MLPKFLQLLETYYTLKPDSDLKFIQITAIFDMKEFGLRHVTVNSGKLYFAHLMTTLT